MLIVDCRVIIASHRASMLATNAIRIVSCQPPPLRLPATQTREATAAVTTFMKNVAMWRLKKWLRSPRTLWMSS